MGLFTLKVLPGNSTLIYESSLCCIPVPPFRQDGLFSILFTGMIFLDSFSSSFGAFSVPFNERINFSGHSNRTTEM